MPSFYNTDCLISVFGTSHVYIKRFWFSNYLMWDYLQGRAWLTMICGTDSHSVYAIVVNCGEDSLPLLWYINLVESKTKTDNVMQKDDAHDNEKLFLIALKNCLHSRDHAELKIQNKINMNFAEFDILDQKCSMFSVARTWIENRRGFRNSNITWLN